MGLKFVMSVNLRRIKVIRISFPLSLGSLQQSNQTPVTSENLSPATPLLLVKSQNFLHPRHMVAKPASLKSGLRDEADTEFLSW